MGLFIQGHQLPDGGVAMTIPQGIQGHLHAVVPQEGMVIQELEDLHDHLDRQPGGDRRAYPPLGGEAQQAQGGESALPVVDHGRLDGQALGCAGTNRHGVKECKSLTAKG
jgi:hypothetical protein